MGISFGNILRTLGPLASFIPGIGPAVGAGLTAVGGLIEGNSAQNQANAARQNQQNFLNFLQQNYGKALSEAFQTNPYPEAGQYDPYSPALNEARTGAFRDDTARGLQSAISGIDYYLRPQGGVRSSAMEYAKAQAVRDASAQNAAFMRNLRIQGGVERYNNAVRASQDRFSRISTLLGQTQGLGSQYGNIYTNAQNNANDIYGGLANSVAAIGQLGGLGGGPRGGKTGSDRGNNTMTTNQQTQAANAGGQIGGDIGAVLGGGSTVPLFPLPSFDPSKYWGQ